jgi:hypothetical protein
LPALIACEYGPIASGAFSVEIVSFFIYKSVYLSS